MLPSIKNGTTAESSAKSNTISDKTTAIDT